MSWRNSILIALSMFVFGFVFVGMADGDTKSAASNFGTALVVISFIAAPIVRFGTQPFIKFVKESTTRLKNIQFKSPKQKKLVIGLGIFLLLAFFGSLMPENQTLNTNVATSPPTEDLEAQRIAIEQAAAQKATEQAQKEAAKKELLEIMALAKQANLVTTYEFLHLDEGATQNVVYVTGLWYTRTVTFKKDFLGKIASLKKIATGYHRFEVRDAYSNEKVAEVTAFTGSLEVYK